MKLRGGYNVPLAGRPAEKVDVPGEPEALYLPLRTPRLHFNEVLVSDNEQVRQGQALAVDPSRYRMPLLAPRGGMVSRQDGRIVLQGLTQEDEEPYRNGNGNGHGDGSGSGHGEADADARHGLHAKPAGSEAARRQKLVDLGAWTFFRDASTGLVPDPAAQPQAILVSTVNFEPFSARGSVQIGRRLAGFARGLEHLQSLLEYQPIYLVVPHADGELADRVAETVRGHAYLKVVHVPRRYPFDHPALLARHLGLRLSPAAGRSRSVALAAPQAEGPAGHAPQRGQSVWALRVEGVLAVDRAMTLSMPSTVRIVSVGGPGVERPTHVKAMIGYPLRAILDFCQARTHVRVVLGGALTGRAWSPQCPEQAGLDAECTALTVVEDLAPRRLLGWLRGGGTGRQKPSSSLLGGRAGKPQPMPMTTALGGERRGCISCQACQRVCPAGLWPHLLHKHLQRGRLADAHDARLDLCVECGLCAYVCPAKLELLQQFRDARAALAAEQAAWTGPPEPTAAEAAAAADAGNEVRP
jgi:Na+-translocating ferredoxin:NAD+ oxidoreductase RnfC subunit